MSMISLIAAVDEQLALGKDNQLLCHLPADLKHFKTLTIDKPVIMGRKTFTSIGRPLPKRTNIVLSKTLDDIKGVTVVTSLQDALTTVQNAPEIMIIGGALLYREALPLADRLYITHIHHQFKADVFFPPIAQNEWHCIEQTSYTHDDNNAYDMTFCTYERV